MLEGLLIGRPGWTELLIVVGAIVLLFGASKIPELARSVGQAKAEYKKGAQLGEQELAEMEEDDEDEDNEAQTADSARA